VKRGFKVHVEAGAGAAASFPDPYYLTAGAKIVPAAGDALAGDVVLKVRPPTPAEVAQLTPGAALLSFVYPAQNGALLQSLAAQRTTTLAMDQVPRISRAQVRPFAPPPSPTPSLTDGVPRAHDHRCLTRSPACQTSRGTAPSWRPPTCTAASSWGR
jgi:hypothetical protein